MRRWRTAVSGAAIALIVGLGARAKDDPDKIGSDRLVASTIAMLRIAQPGEQTPYSWSALNLVPTITWENPPAPDPARTAPENFVRLGAAAMEGRSMRVIATGTRTTVSSVTLADTSVHAPSDVLGFLAESRIKMVLARCGDQNGKEDTRWYWLRGQGRPVVLEQSIRSTGRMVNERFTLNLANELGPRKGRELDAGRDACV